MASAIWGRTGVRNKQGSSYHTLRSILAVVGLMYGIDVLLHSQPVDAWRPPGSAPDAADITRITIGVSFLELLASNSPSVGGSDPAQWYGRSMARLVSPVPHAW